MTKQLSLTTIIALLLSLVLFTGIAFAEEVTDVDAEVDVEVTTTEENEGDTDVTEDETDESEKTEEENTDTTDAAEDEDTSDEETDEESEVDEEKVNDLRARIKAKMELQAKQRALLQERKESHEAALKERIEKKRNTQINARVALAKRIVVRAKNIHERLSALVEKITARVESLEEQGADTEKTMEQLATAELHLDDAALSIGELEVLINDWVEINAGNDAATIDDTVQENKELFKETVASTKESLRSAYKAMKDAVRTLKAAAKEVKVEATVEVESEE